MKILIIIILALITMSPVSANQNDCELIQINSTHWEFKTTQTDLAYGTYNYQAFSNNISSDYRTVEYYVPTTFKNVAGVYHFWNYSNIPELYTAINNESILSLSGSTYTFHYPFYHNSTGTFDFSESTHLESNNDGSPSYFRWTGNVEFDNYKIIGWNTVSDTPAPTTDSTRAYVFCDSGATGNITNGNMSYLGYGTKYGVHLTNLDNMNILNNTFSNSKFGLLLENCDNNEISDNDISYNTEYGLYIMASEYNSFANNSVYSNSYSGIFLDTAHHNNLINNTIYSNGGASVDSDGICMAASTYNNLTDNTIYSNSHHGINLLFSTNSIFTNNNISDTLNGYYDYNIFIMSTSSTIIDTVKTSNYYRIDTSSNPVTFNNGVDYDVTVTTDTVIQDNPTSGTESVNITVVSGTIGQLDVSSLSASTFYQLQYNNGTSIETKSTDGSGTATFTSDISSGTYIITSSFNTPDPLNLNYTTGNYWVNYTWEEDTTIVIDSWNVSQNNTWTNGSSNNWNNVSVGAHGWSNITVWAWNDTIGLSAGYVNDSVQISGLLLDTESISNTIIVRNNPVVLSTTFTGDNINDVKVYTTTPYGSLNYTMTNNSNVWQKTFTESITGYYNIVKYYVNQSGTIYELDSSLGFTVYYAENKPSGGSGSYITPINDTEDIIDIVNITDIIEEEESIIITMLESNVTENIDLVKDVALKSMDTRNKQLSLFAFILMLICLFIIVKLGD